MQCTKCFGHRDTKQFLVPGMQVCNSCLRRMNETLDYLSYNGVQLNMALVAEAQMKEPQTTGEKARTATKRPVETPKP